MAKVQFRFLQLVLSHVTGDKVSVALLHWDGETLRVASSLEPLAVCAPEQRSAIQATVKTFVSRAKQRARELSAEQKPLDSGLADLFRVREGLGSALYWSPVAAVDTRGPADHFEALCSVARLDRQKRRSPRRYSANDLSKDLIQMGRELSAIAPDRVRVDTTVERTKAYQSPLSWKNGHWHHAMPFAVHGLEPDDVDAEVARVIGLVQLALPEGDVPVVVAALPPDPNSAKATRAEAKLICGELADRGCEVVTTKLAGRHAELAQVRRRIERDIRQA
jgi:hypothetical protein